MVTDKMELKTCDVRVVRTPVFVVATPRAGPPSAHSAWHRPHRSISIGIFLAAAAFPCRPHHAPICRRSWPLNVRFPKSAVSTSSRIDGMINARSHFAPVDTSDREPPVAPRHLPQVRRSLTGSFSGPISDEELKQSFTAMRQSSSEQALRQVAGGTPIVPFFNPVDDQAGVGIFFAKSERDGSFYVEKVLPGCAAERCGSIQKGDVVTHVGAHRLQPGLTLDRLRPLIVRPPAISLRACCCLILTRLIGWALRHLREPNISARVGAGRQLRVLSGQPQTRTVQGQPSDYCPIFSRFRLCWVSIGASKQWQRSAACFERKRAAARAPRSQSRTSGHGFTSPELTPESRAAPVFQRTFQEKSTAHPGIDYCVCRSSLFARATGARASTVRTSRSASWVFYNFERFRLVHHEVPRRCVTARNFHMMDASMIVRPNLIPMVGQHITPSSPRVTRTE